MRRAFSLAALFGAAVSPVAAQDYQGPAVDGKAWQARHLCFVADDRTPVFIHLAWEASAQSGAAPR
jgi:hypothetical protein